jgi:hypothetical protein
MDTYLEQAKQDDDKPIPTAADDIMEEQEPEPEAVPRMEPVQQDVPAAPKPKAWEGRTLSLGLRAVTAVLSLVAFSIMLSAMTSAWDGDGYGLYEPYRLVTTLPARWPPPHPLFFFFCTVSPPRIAAA